MPFPSPQTRTPLTLPDGSIHPETVFLNQVIDHPNIEIGDYTYMSDRRVPEDWAAALAPYLYPGAPEALRIGKFCQIAHGVEIITASANHNSRGLTAYPFPIFAHELMDSYGGFPAGADTEIGHDVWIGTRATILPGARIGSGAIIGAGAVVGGEVPDYAVVAGNPARVVRHRFTPDEVRRLLALAWWDWPIEAILAQLPALAQGDLAALEAGRPEA
ncbi:CatB-related O-acetyltransferase [Mesobaculum littorinae]|uniref:CatB-related O-acetyltransferase n=1 Tax=Mesobaculum littorinae TaxID=2486419 RepID=A0A438ACX1_9RHOB|nr:CatB-related O-acetyltransferase [Mesobaculum littorinae]RVV96530.1 CatB-related O-acetyltransferase [Mesobaculum littorinae]